MKSELRNALDECVRQMGANLDNDEMDRAVGLAAMTILEGLLESLDRQAAALERVAATLEKIEPVV